MSRRDSIMAQVLGVAVILVIVAATIWANVANYRECRSHFSAFYCLTRK